MTTIGENDEAYVPIGKQRISYSKYFTQEIYVTLLIRRLVEMNQIYMK